MTPLMASHKEAGAMGWLGRDWLNLCEGAGEGTAAPANPPLPRRRGHRRSPREGQNQRYQGQHNLLVVRCRRRPLVGCALVVCLRDPSFEESRCMGCSPTSTPRFLQQQVGYLYGI